MKNLIKLVILILLGALITFAFLQVPQKNTENFEDKGLEAQREEFLSHKNHMTNTMLNEGNYACCLEKPCTYCIEKTPKHGEGATCTCLEDVVTGVHPCGECIGEILEGHGNKFLAEYFPEAIAEEVGEQHIETLEQIIAEKYGIACASTKETCKVEL